MDLQGLQQDVANDRRLVGGHALREANNEGLNLDDVWSAIVSNGEIIEDYPTDARGPSCLLLCWIGSLPVHAVVAWSLTKTYAFLITIYCPDRDTKWQWLQGFRVRGPRLP
jgi:hypothetical protein